MIKYRVIKFTFLIDQRRIKLGFYHTNNNILKTKYNMRKTSLQNNQTLT